MAEKSKKKAKAATKKTSALVKSKKNIDKASDFIGSESSESQSAKVEMKKKNPVAIPVPGKSSLIENPIPEKPPLEQKFGLSTQVKVEGSSEEMTVSKFVHKNAKEPDQLIVNLSHSLLRKLKEQALDEGISLEEFVTELLSEGVVLRAWEIVERKNQMKGHNASAGSGMGGNNRHSMPNGNQSGNSNRNGNQRGGNKGHRGMSHMRYQTIMEDKATFLEYVRNQERTRR